MKKKFSVEQIVGVLKQAEVGVPVAELIRKVGISELRRGQLRILPLNRTAIYLNLGIVLPDQRKKLIRVALQWSFARVLRDDIGRCLIAIEQTFEMCL
jgi:hypothetical protein